MLGLALASRSRLRSRIPAPFGRGCAPQDGVRFCAGTRGHTRAELRRRAAGRRRDPAAERQRPVPHDRDAARLGRRQERLRVDHEPDGDGNTTFHYNNVYFAQHGYAVLNYTARGWGDSCGSAASRLADPTGCAKGWIHLADQRYEAHDTQYLLGLLADEGVDQAGRDRRHRHLLRRRAERRARATCATGCGSCRAGSGSRRGQPEGQGDVDRGGVPALAVVGPRRRRSSRTAASSTSTCPPPTESREPLGVARSRATCRACTRSGWRAATTRRPAPTPTRTSRTGSRASNAGEPSDAEAHRDRATRSTTSTRASGCPAPRPAPMLLAERLDRRPVPAGGVAAHLQRAARRQPGRRRCRSSSATSGTRAARTSPTIDQRLPGPGRGVLRPLPQGRRAALRRTAACAPTAGCARRLRRRAARSRAASWLAAAPGRGDVRLGPPPRRSPPTAATRRRRPTYDPIAGGTIGGTKSCTQVAAETRRARRTTTAR